MEAHRKVLVLFIALSIFVLSSFASLQKKTEDNGYSVKLTEFSSPPKIDGLLEDPFWEKAVVIDHFTQYEPQEGAEPSEKTVAYIGYDRKNLYIGIRCFDSNPKAVRACLTQRDKAVGDDEITVYLDTFNDKKLAFTFQVNPCGVQSDGIYNETRRRSRRSGRSSSGTSGFSRIDKNWDTYFLSNAHMDEKGYTVELSIPFKSLRFPHVNTQTWGLQLQRNIRRKNEEIYWHPRSRDINGFLSQIGKLHIEGELEKGRNLEIMPVITGLKESGEKINPEPSLNLKYGITSDLTADLTLNPDFSQIEADMPQIGVNQRYPLYYPEKRPFFLEGKNYFDTPLELVYTRTIANPIWGTKLTGKMGKTTIGFLSAYDESPPDIDIPLSEEEDNDELQASRGFVNIFRLKQDLFSESYIGMILTDKQAGDSWASITRNFNRTVGVDGHFKFYEYNRFSFQIVGSNSRVKGPLTSESFKTGWIPAMNFSLIHRSRHWSLSAEYTHLPEDFEVSTGYIRRKDIRQIRTRIGYYILPQNEYIVDIRPTIEYRRAYDFSNVLTDEEARIGWYINGWRGSFIYGGYTVEMERYKGIDFHRKSFRFRLSSEPFSWLSGSISLSAGDGIYYDENPYLGYKVSYGFQATLRPLTNLRAYYSLNNNAFYQTKGGEQVYRINILSQRISYQLSRTVSLRLITDYNDYDKELYNSILLSYEYRPGTVFYFGIDDNQEKDDLGIFRNQGRFYFIKFSYWWRI